MKILGNLVSKTMVAPVINETAVIFQEIYFWLMSGSESEADLYRI